MSSWNEIAAAHPELTEAVRVLFDAHKHKTMATIRRDGSPRISGTEAMFIDGDLWFGGMWQARKALDLQRDPRFGMHSASEDPPAWKGDARISGRAVEITDPDLAAKIINASGGEAPPGPSHLFRADITEVVLTRLGDPADHLVVEFWREGEGIKRVERR